MDIADGHWLWALLMACCMHDARLYLHDMMEVADEKYGAQPLASKAAGQPQHQLHCSKSQSVYVVVHLTILCHTQLSHGRFKAISRRLRMGNKCMKPAVIQRYTSQSSDRIPGNQRSRGGGRW